MMSMLEMRILTSSLSGFIFIFLFNKIALTCCLLFYRFSSPKRKAKWKWGGRQVYLPTLARRGWWGQPHTWWDRLYSSLHAHCSVQWRGIVHFTSPALSSTGRNYPHTNKRRWEEGRGFQSIDVTGRFADCIAIFFLNLQFSIISFLLAMFWNSYHYPPLFLPNLSLPNPFLLSPVPETILISHSQSL